MLEITRIFSSALTSRDKNIEGVLQGGPSGHTSFLYFISSNEHNGDPDDLWSDKSD